METDVTCPRRLDFRQQKAASEFVPLVEATRETTTAATRRSCRRSGSGAARPPQPWPGSSSETDPDEETLEWPPPGGASSGINRARPRSLCRQRRLPGEHPLLQPERGGKDRKAPPSPSLLMRVKEHFVNRVLLPQPAVMADLRQRAVEAFEASLSEREQPEVRPHHTKSVICRGADGSAKRAAYRRRSISDDTYNRPVRTAPGVAQRASTLIDDGVVCSNVDLLSIVRGRRENSSAGTSEAITRTSSAATDFSVTSSAECDSVPDGGNSSIGHDAEWPAGACGMDHTDGAGSDHGAVHEVEYDEHGQTWDVYGAEYDPEVLGAAIEKHLERIVRDQQRADDDDGGCDDTDTSPAPDRQAANDRRRHDVGILLRILRCLIPARRQHAR
ncbi:hypothetical protein NP493_93g04025 [Ridgeia piscesae]|uniref:G protein-regulated inducer of neurite outgrowth C-terminal domain-containing protein n=1 Tax=Ridgeia piscesae TaxID=27915 RepID=A0AAD9P871_RIDPI|nr:hypothetical protein NP493_93g04025 [Ridgeia piscesae]